MSPRKRERNEEPELFDTGIKTAPCIPEITRAVDEWREKTDKGVTKTTDILLNYWFHTDHRLADGRAFKYHESQRRALETLIYLYEIACVRRHTAILPPSPFRLVGSFLGSDMALPSSTVNH